MYIELVRPHGLAFRGSLLYQSELETEEEAEAEEGKGIIGFLWMKWLTFLSGWMV